jgi:hypothetical protein
MGAGGFIDGWPANGQLKQGFWSALGWTGTTNTPPLL